MPEKHFSFELNFKCVISFLPEKFKCLNCFPLGLIFTFPKTLPCFLPLFRQSFGPSNYEDLVSYIQRLLPCNALYFGSGKCRCIYATLLP